MKRYRNAIGFSLPLALVLLLVLFAPVQAQTQAGVFGQITAVDVSDGVVEIDGQPFSLALSTSIHKQSGDGWQQERRTVLEPGQYVVYTLQGDSLQSLRIQDPARVDP